MSAPDNGGMTEAQIFSHDVRGVTVAIFRGRSILDQSTVLALGRTLYDLVENQGKGKLLLDFTDVTNLSSSMLGVLVRVRKRLAEGKGRMVILGLRPELRRVFAITRLDRLFEFYDSDAEAMDSFEAVPPADKPR